MKKGYMRQCLRGGGGSLLSLVFESANRFRYHIHLSLPR